MNRRVISMERRENSWLVERNGKVDMNKDWELYFGSNVIK